MDEIGEYQVIKKLGAGGMGEVLLCRHPRMSRQVAVKLLNDQAGDSAREKFNRLADTMAGIQHPNTVQLHEMGIHKGRPYFVMEYVDGEDLSSLLESKNLVTPDQALFLARSILLGLAHAHSRGVIHRHIKPTNLRLTSEGVLKILDFGIADLSNRSISVTRSASSRTGIQPGADDYLSPEQIHGMLVDERTDLFSTGIVLYELLTGEHPFRRRTRGEAHGKTTHQDPAPPRLLRPDLPLYICWTVLRALETRPENRHESAESFADKCRMDGERFQTGDREAEPAFGQSDSRVLDAHFLYVLGREAEYEGSLRKATSLYSRALFQDPALEPAHERMTEFADAQVKARDLEALAKEVGRALVKGRTDHAEEAMHRIRLLEPDWEANEDLRRLDGEIRELSYTEPLLAQQEPASRSIGAESGDSRSDAADDLKSPGGDERMPGPADLPDAWPSRSREKQHGQMPTPFDSSASMSTSGNEPGVDRPQAISGHADISAVTQEPNDPEDTSTTQPLAAQSSGGISEEGDDTQAAPAEEKSVIPPLRRVDIAPPQPAGRSTPHGRMEHLFIDRIKNGQFDAAKSLLQELVDDHGGIQGVRAFVRYFKPKIDAEQTHQLALAAYRSDQHGEALEKCDETLRLNPRHGRTQALKNRILIGEEADDKRGRVRKTRERVRMHLSDMPTERSLGIDEARVLLRSEKDLREALNLIPGDRDAQSLLRMVKSQLTALPSNVITDAKGAEEIESSDPGVEELWEMLDLSVSRIPDEILQATVRKVLKRTKVTLSGEGDAKLFRLEAINDSLTSLLQVSEEPFAATPSNWILLADQSLNLRRPGDPLASAFLELSLRVARVALDAASLRMRELAASDPEALRAETERVGSHAAFYTLRAEADSRCKEVLMMVREGTLAACQFRLKAASVELNQLIEQLQSGPGDPMGGLAEALLEQVPEALGAGHPQGMNSLSARLEAWTKSAAPQIERRRAILRLREEGQSKEMNGELHEALEINLKIVELESNDDTAREAVQRLEQRLERETKLASYYRSALDFQEGGKLQDAIGELERLLDLDPGHENAQTMLADCQESLASTEKIRALRGNVSNLSETNRWNAAREQCEEFLRVLPNDDEAARSNQREKEEQPGETDIHLLKRLERQVGSLRSLASELQPLLEQSYETDLEQISAMFDDARKAPSSKKLQSLARAIETLTRGLLETRRRLAEEKCSAIAPIVDKLRAIDEADRPYIGEDLTSQAGDAVERFVLARQQQDLELLEKETRSIEGLVSRLETRREVLLEEWLPGLEERIRRIDTLLEHMEPSTESESISMRALEEKRRTAQLMSGRLLHPLPRQIDLLDEIISGLKRNQSRAIESGKAELRELCEKLRSRAEKSKRSVAKSAKLSGDLFEIYQEVDHVDDIADPDDLARLRTKITSIEIPGDRLPLFTLITTSVSVAALIVAASWGSWMWWQRPRAVVIQLVPWGEISSIVNVETREVMGYSETGAAFHRTELPRGTYQIKARNELTRAEASFIISVPQDEHFRHELSKDPDQTYEFLQPLADLLESDPYFSGRAELKESP